MSNHSTLDPQSVQATMLLPLWGRAEYSRQNPDILQDEDAIRIIKDCGYDFTPLAAAFGEYGGICYVIRARKFDDAVKAFIRVHPKCTVVNIGAGLDTTFSRVDNGLIRWYNLDLPNAIDFRRTVLPDSERNSSIAKSFFDTTWFEDVAFDEADSILFISGGVFYYFHEEELMAVVRAMAEHFPGGELYFDAESKSALSMSNRMVQKAGNKNAMMYFYVNNAKTLEAWSPRVRLVSCDPFFKDIPKKKSWAAATRRNMRLGDALGMMKFIHLRFLKSVRGE